MSHYISKFADMYGRVIYKTRMKDEYPSDDTPPTQLSNFTVTIT